MGTNASISIIALFGFSVLISYVTAWLILISPAIRLFTDRPGGRKIHQKITPRIGGISIVIPFLLFAFIWHFSFFMNLQPLPSHLFIAVILGSIGITVVGLFDDITLVSIPNSTKLVMEFFIAALLISISGIKLDTIHFLGQTYNMGFAAWPLTMLWLVGITNAINIIDGVDGLASAVSLVSLCTIGILAHLSGDHSIVIFCALCAGLIGGFLAHNISPARIFLGDTGSLFLGMMIGLLCVYLVSTTSNPYPVVIAPLIVGFPLVDVIVAMARRFFRAISTGESFIRSLLKTMVADNDHIHHRLLFRGLRHSQTTIVITIYAVTTCAVAVVVSMVQDTSTLFFLIYLILLTALFAYKLDFFDSLTNLNQKSADQKQKPESKIKNRKNIVVLNANEYLKHALEFFKQDIFSLHFVEIGQKPDDSVKFSAVLVINNHIDNQTEDLDQAIYLSTRFHCPLILIADEFAASSFERTKKLTLKTLFVRKPIYVPKLFNDLYLFAVNGDSASMLDCQFTNETRVLPFIGRK